MLVVKPITFNNLSFERDSDATYYDENGVLQTAPPDVLRHGYNPDTLESIGPIFESAQTNRLVQSNLFSATQWVKFDATITDGAGTSPDGTINAARLGGGTGTMSQSFSSLANIAFSIYFKMESPPSYPGGGGSNFFEVSVGTLSGSFADARWLIYSDHDPVSTTPAVQSSIQKLQNGWYRATVYKPSSSNAVLVSRVSNFLIYGAQAEVISGTFSSPSSYILSPGLDNGVRAADVQNSPPSMVSSNIPEPDHDEWDDSTPYSADDLVTVLGNYNRNYKCVTEITSLPAQPPYIDTDHWIDIGATNRWRMFDMNVGADLQSTGTGVIDVTLSLDEQIDSVALFNINGSSAKITMYYESEIVYEQTIDLVSAPSESQWYNYWFDRRRQTRDCVFLNLPPTIPSSVRVQVFGEDGDEVGLGKLVVGSSFYVGFAEYGNASIGITDYSTKEPDTFGNYFVQERRYVGKMDVRTVVDPGNELYIRDSLAEVRATASAYIVETQYEPILTLGFYKDFTVLFSTPANSYCTTQIEGI